MDERPTPFSAFTTPEFWDDPHISEQMLRNHLDPDSQMASRPAAFIDMSVDWIVSALDLDPRSRVLDLGCGPGLYSHRLARMKFIVDGLDVSSRSIDYARTVANKEGLQAAFRKGNYLTDDLGSDYDAALLIYEDYSALSPRQRETLLSRVRDALRPEGQFLFDVTSSERFSQFTDGIVEAQNLMNGFWAEPPYRGSHETWTYPDEHLVLERYTIRSAGEVRQFWNWMHCLTPEIVARELEICGFTALRLYGDVAGKPYSPGGESFTVLAERNER